MTKVTLSADEETIEQAKRLAEENNTSVSSMFERFIRMMVKRWRPTRSIGPIARKASGIISLPQGKTPRAVLEDALLDKYELRR